MSTEQVEQVESGKGVGNYVETLFPFDWDLVRHAGSEPIPHHIRKTRKNNDPKNQGGRGRIRTNHFSKPDNRSNRFSNSTIAFLVNLTPVQ